MKIKLGVGGVILRKNQVLLVKLSYGPGKGKYTIPGGLVQNNETISQAITREVYEETKVRARIEGVIGVRSRLTEKDSSDHYITFLMKHEQGEPSPDNYEVLEAGFYPIDEALSNPLISDFSRLLISKVRSKTFKIFRKDSFLPSISKNEKIRYEIYV